MKKIPFVASCIVATILLSMNIHAQEIPLPEHPRPDFQRNDWINLNGIWAFQFDSLDAGMEQQWYIRPIFTEEALLIPAGIQTPIP